MSSTATHAGNGHQPHRTAMDEMSLAAERSAQTPQSEPDTLEVRDDSMAIVQGTVNDLRRPLLIAAAVAGVVALLAVSVRVLIMTSRRGASADAS